MATYYDFYLGQKVNEKFTIVGPYVFDPINNENKLKPLYATSRSFIDWDSFRDFMDHISMEEMNPDQLKLMCADYSLSAEEEHLKSCAYVCSLKEMIRNSRNGGLRQGYILLEDFEYIRNQNYFVEYIYELTEFHSPEEVAEMDFETKSKYGKIAFIETYSLDYIANKIADAACCGITKYENEDDYYIICVIDY